MLTILGRVIRFALALPFAILMVTSVYPASGGGGGLPQLVQSQFDSWGFRGLTLFGANIAMQGDVAAAVVPYGYQSSTTRIYQRSGSTWNTVGNMPDAWSIATDGQRVVAHLAHTPAPQIQIRSGPNWATGNTLTIGAHTYSDPEKGVSIFGDLIAVTGADEVEVWEKPIGPWFLAHQLQGSDVQSGDEFARSVTLYDRIIAAGAPGANGDVGAAYVFQKSGSQWIEVAKLEPPPGSSAIRFGSSVAVYEGQLAVGAPDYVGGPDERGAVFMYRQVGVNWVLSQVLTHSLSGCCGRIGGIVDIDEEWLIAGGGAPNAPIWHLRDGVWTPFAELSSTLLFGGDGWGKAVAVQAGWAMNGAPAWNFDGVVQFYELAPPPNTFCTGKLNSDGCVGQIGTTDLPAETQVLEFKITASDILGQKPVMLFYGYDSTALPFLGGTLCVQPPLRRTPPDLAGGDATPCGGTMTFDFDTWIKAQNDPLLVAGAGAVAQYWYRDPGDPFGVGLTDAVSLELLP